jgi:hypothetical protein
VEQWKYDWLEWCEILPNYLSMLQKEKNIWIIRVWLENLEQFGRTVEELKGWGGLNEALRKLEGAGEDWELLSKVEEIELNAKALEKLGQAWEAGQPQEIVGMKHMTDKRLRTRLQEQLEEWKNGEVPSNNYGITDTEVLQYQIFTCFTRSRDTIGDQRAKWLELYHEYELFRENRGIKVGYLGEGEAWLAWITANPGFNQLEPGQGAVLRL